MSLRPWKFYEIPVGAVAGNFLGQYLAYRFNQWWFSRKMDKP